MMYCLGGVNKSFSKYPHEELLAFSDLAIKRFKEDNESAIIDGLFRVDIFMRKNGTFAVNEFESLEANYDGPPNMEAATRSYLITYWLRKIELLFENTID